MKIKHILAATMLLAAMNAPAFDLPAGSVFYTCDTGRGFLENIGNGKVETYDSAIGIHNEALVGCQITGVRLPFNSLQGISDLKVWLTKALTLNKKVNVPDIMSVDVAGEIVDGYIDVVFDQPYTIDSDGLYVGYTFTVNELCESSQRPVIVTDEVHPEGYFAHSSKTTIQWMDKTRQLGYSLAMQVMVAGLPEVSATVTTVDAIDMQYDRPVPIELCVANKGWAGIKSIEYTYRVGDRTGEGIYTIDSDQPRRIYGYDCRIPLAVPEVASAGDYTLEVELTKVNGLPNAGTANTAAEAKVKAHEFLPIHRPLTELYTGTWCGWCIRGKAMFEGMTALYGDEFIGVAYHNDDPMTIMAVDQFPQYPTNFPWSFIDRGEFVNPFFGNSSESLGFRYDWDQRRRQPAPADVAVRAWLDGPNSVAIECSLDFENDHTAAAYKLAYLLVHDGMKGDPSSPDYAEWLQGNAYSAEIYPTNERYFGQDPWLGKYVSMPAYIPNSVFDHVVVMSSPVKGVAGSVPASIQARKILTHNYSFDLTRAHNIDNRPIIQDTSKLSVVAVLIDADGRVVNANKCAVGASDGVQGVATDPAEPVAVARYDINGRRVGHDARGLIIELMSDGTARKLLR